MITKPKPGFLVNPLHPLSNGLVAWWLFNEGTGLTLNNYKPIDPRISLDLHGDITDAPLISDIWAGSIHGGSVHFDGSDTFVNFTTSELGTALDGSRGFSASAWVYLKSTTGTDRIFFVVGDLDFTFANMRVSGTQTGFTIRPEFGTAAIVDVTRPGLNQWFHVAGTCNFAEGIARIYVNGVLAGSDSVNFDVDVWTQGSPTATDRIGSGLGAENLNGYIDDLRFYNRRLSDGEVALLHAEPYSNVLTNKLPKFIQTLSASTTPVQNTSRFKRRRRLLYTRY